MYINSIATLAVFIIGKHPKIGFAFGLLVSLVASILLIFTWNDFNQLNHSPRLTSVAELSRSLGSGSREYVLLNDAVADCHKLITSKGGKFQDIAFSNINKNILVVGNYSGSINDCELISGPLQGVARMHGNNDRFVEVLKTRINFNLDQYKITDQVIDICTYCGPGNSKTGLIVFSGLIMCGFVLMGISPKLHKQYQAQVIKRQTETNIPTSTKI